MRVLVYGAGVIGSALIHVLCQAGNEVTIAARARTKVQLETRGLKLYHLLKKKHTVDMPRIVEIPSTEEAFDVVFSVMQNQQQLALLDTLAAVNAPYVILVGNNLTAAEAEARILEDNQTQKTVLFGFQPSAGHREPEETTVIYTGNGKMDIGGLHRRVSQQEQSMLEKLVDGTGYRFHWMDDMEAYYLTHAAMILPIVYVSYACGCNLRKASRAQRRAILDATAEACDALKVKGIFIQPDGDDAYFRKSVKRLLMATVYFVMAKTKFGELAATDHCKNAPEEMQFLDEKFNAFLGDARSQMPVWEQLRREAQEQSKCI